MIIKSPHIIQHIIEHRHLFVELVTYIEENGGAIEIPVQLYRSLVRRAVESIEQSDSPNRNADCQRLRHALNERNLQRERLIVRIDPASNRLVLAPFLMDMLRHFDVGRMSGLSQTELEDLRLGLNQSLTALKAMPFDKNDDGFREELRLLRRRIQDTLGKMQESIAALEAQGNHLSEIVEQQDITSVQSVGETQKALDRINRIYQRYILPALAFLDPKTKFKQGVPASTAIQSIGQLADDAGSTALASEMVLAVNAVWSYINDIEELRRVLERYVRQSQRQRQQYDQIEKAFNALKDAMLEQQTDNLRQKYIPVSHPAIQSPGIFLGIKRMRVQRLDWHDIDHQADIEEYTDRRIEELRQQRDRSGVVEIDPSRTGMTASELNDQLRQQRIHDLLKDWVIPSPCHDLHAALDIYLKTQMDDYQLQDMLEGLDWVMAVPNITFTAEFRFKQIEDDQHTLIYFPLTITVPSAGANHATA